MGIKILLHLDFTRLGLQIDQISMRFRNIFSRSKNVAKKNSKCECCALNEAQKLGRLKYEVQVKLYSWRPMENYSHFSPN